MQSEFVAWAKAKLWRALRRIVGLTIGWGIASVLLFLMADTLVSGDFEGWTGLVIGAAVAVIGLVALSIASADWIRNMPTVSPNVRYFSFRDQGGPGRLYVTGSGGAGIIVGPCWRHCLTVPIGSRPDRVQQVLVLD